ncbi:MAG TPA: outer membrane lipoprotein carrier protein LolA [Bacteroidia bacterium]|nr:outer membrane lipoprotein carrier protein LolA [Bacteroidia bacterium]QQR94999.1 MAG: outer membrane lipoprotein carrier protein LolA [Bacteroidota bacterium]MBP7714411.1 outer membrane lipoprotein carrier protein LolA [Bacteroidia bacterium]MBP8669181.1 outer membrane lipoprotein carrier protein LolA [Bacteroidia bacterium]HOZ82560.1 outer membrane lipoprotein carrier protein LolA [Bacteroidia bacterium]
MRLLIAFILFIWIPVFAKAQQEPLNNPAELTEKLKQASISNNTIKADFIEQRFMSALKEPQTSYGIFYYKKENKLRWEKTKPTNYVFISENNKVRVKENNHEKDVSSYNQVVGRIKDLMLTLVNGDFSNGKQFDPQYFQTKSEYIVKLKPRNKRMSNAFDYIQLSFNKKNLLLEELAFYEKSGDRNIMKFSNQMVNTELNDTLFKNF